VSVAESGSIYLACEQRVLEVSPDGRETWSAPCSRGIPFPPAVSSDGAIYFKTHDTMVWGWEDPSESYDSLEGHRSTIWKARFTHTDTTENTWAQSLGGDCAAMCASDGTPIGGYKSTLVIGTREISMPGAGGTLALSDDGTLYVAMRDGLVAIEVRLKPDTTYEKKWRTPIDHGVMHPVVDGAGTIFVVGDDRTVHAISAAGDRVWTWPMPNPKEGAGTAGWTHGLAVGPGRLYVALFSDLLALGG
jgi:outer membrane protein assembly factor BamB